MEAPGQSKDAKEEDDSAKGYLIDCQCLQRAMKEASGDVGLPGEHEVRKVVRFGESR